MRQHRALDNDDVLHLIFEQFSASPDHGRANWASSEKANDFFMKESIRMRALAGSARVCKSFHEPAVDVLWKHLSSLEDLMQLMYVPMPPRQYDQFYSRWILKFDLSPDRAARFLHYSRRVRSIRYSLEPTQVLEPPSVYDYLAAQNHGAPLLPLLEDCCWKQVVTVDSGLLTLVSPSLHRLNIRFTTARQGEIGGDASLQEGKDAVMSLLHKLCAKAPFIRTLELSGDFESSWIEPITKLRQLQILDIAHHSQDITSTSLLHSLAELEDLHEFRLQISGAQRLERGGRRFHALRSLAVQADDLSDISPFVAALSSPRYQETVVISLNSCDFSSILHYASWSSKVGARGDGIADQPLIDILEPLTHLHDLTTVHLSFASDLLPFSMSDLEMRTMVEAWPKATELSLIYKAAGGFPSIHALSDIARLCPLLTTLILPGIDLSALSELTTFPTSSHGLRYLGIGDNGWESPVADPARLAQFLDCLFPRLEVELHLADGWGELVPENWKSALESMIGLQSSRKQHAPSSGAADFDTVVHDV
ncbi:hypothetical protein A0H81_06334 [Grifola frondosa]|uniref:F-box domain-containing protein n=1 Tax=Grifola frondosa TaxID=5627 RepID=A0A1C7MBK3_GRIFR|nr:hypothetical protein A0H81_06334 [Grifola frondosa]